MREAAPCADQLENVTVIDYSIGAGTLKRRVHGERAQPSQEDRVLSEPIVAGVSNTSTPAAAEPKEAGQTGSSTLLSLVMKSLEDDVAEDIVTISLAGKSSEADSMVVASGRSTRHVSAIADKLMDRLKHEAGIIARVEGKDAADWVLIDAGDVIVHVFRPEVREFYQLEKMWMTSPDATARAAGQ